MKRPMFIDNDQPQPLSRGSSGFRRSAEALAKTADTSDKDKRIAELEKELASAKHHLDAAYDAAGLQVVNAKPLAMHITQILAERDAEIVTLKAELNRRIFSEFPDFSKAFGETETDKSTPMQVDLNPHMVDQADVTVDLPDKSTKRVRHLKGQEPWTLEGISKQAWYKKNKKAKADIV